VATNAVIERRGPRVLFVTNEGFTDVPFIGRMDKQWLYDLHWSRPKPLVRRRDCLGVAGRVASDGSEVEPLHSDSLTGLLEQLVGAAGEGDAVAVAVCLLFAYVDNQHEVAVAESIRGSLPGVPVSVSHEVSPLWREYERASTTIADAFVKPVVDGYVTGVGDVLEQQAGVNDWNLMASNGGYLSSAAARGRPAQLLLSGLAGGAISAAHFARMAGHDAVFSLDMGGTSCDIGLILEGAQRYATEFELGFGLPVSLPSVAVRTVGAGGGSVAWVDRGGMLHVGPRSAGALPGPAAYAQGGEEATVTDADLVLGRLDPDYFLGGDVPLSLSRATEAVSRVGAEVGLGVRAAALAIAEIADENMANAIRLIAVERGLDIRELALMAFGGAGPGHARGVAERLEMDTVLIPPHPGLCSALGVAIAQARVDRMRTVSARSGTSEAGRLAYAERELRAQAMADLRGSVGGDDEAAVIRTGSLRYAGQNYELQVPIAGGELDEGGWETLIDDFRSEHERQYGFSLPDEPVELIDLRATAYLVSDSGSGPTLPDAADGPTGAGGPAQPDRPCHPRAVWFGPEPVADCPILTRSSLHPGSSLRGPAVIQEPDSTTLVWPGDTVAALDGGVLELRLGRRS
jgi:N-methylhydantoinase A